jgi:Fic family protein
VPGPEWKEDLDTPQLQTNLRELYPLVFEHATSVAEPSVDLVKGWHIAMHQGITLPSLSYSGNFRGDSLHPDLLDYEVHIKGVWGSRSYHVFGEVERLMEWLQSELHRLDRHDGETAERDLEVLRVAATLHGEWVRIHPFANGNGRTARLWLTWVLARFSLPPLVPVRPRPVPPYNAAAQASMTGEHEPTFQMLCDAYSKQADEADE